MGLRAGRLRRREDGDWLPDFRLDAIVVGDSAPLPLYVDVKPNDYDEEDLQRRVAMVWTSEPDAVRRGAVVGEVPTRGYSSPRAGDAGTRRRAIALAAALRQYP